MRNIFRLAIASPLSGANVGSTATAIVFALTLLLAVPITAQPVNYTVCPLPSCDFQTPDAAVNNPGILGGDVIDITVDTYVLGGPMQVGNSITINGNGSTLDANGNRALDISGTSSIVTVNDVNIFNGLATVEEDGGAIIVSGGAQT